MAKCGSTGNRCTRGNDEQTAKKEKGLTNQMWASCEHEENREETSLSV